MTAAEKFDKPIHGVGSMGEFTETLTSGFSLHPSGLDREAEETPLVASSLLVFR